MGGVTGERLTWTDEAEWKWAWLCVWSAAGYMDGERLLMVAREGCSSTVKAEAVFPSPLGTLGWSYSHKNIHHTPARYINFRPPVQPQRSDTRLPVALEYDILCLMSDA